LSREDLDRNDAQKIGGIAAEGGVLNEGVLHDPDQSTPSGVRARPFMPLLAIRPLVLALISSLPTGLSLDT
jgi:hypothetical protein